MYKQVEYIILDLQESINNNHLTYEPVVMNESGKYIGQIKDRKNDLSVGIQMRIDSEDVEGEFKEFFAKQILRMIECVDRKCKTMFTDKDIEYYTLYSNEITSKKHHFEKTIKSPYSGNIYDLDIQDDGGYLIISVIFNYGML